MRGFTHSTRVTTEPAQPDYVPVSPGFARPGEIGAENGTRITAYDLNHWLKELLNASIGITGEAQDVDDEQLKRAILSVGYRPVAGDAFRMIRVNASETALEASPVQVDGDGILQTNSASHAQMPYGTTAERPVSPGDGAFRINSQTVALEFYHGGQWYGSGDIPSGTRMLFLQATAPAGWTQITTANLDDAAIRIVTGTGGGTGGSKSFSSMLNGEGDIIGDVTVNGHSLSVDELPPISFTYDKATGVTGGPNEVESGDERFSYTATQTNTLGAGHAHAHTASHDLKTDFDINYADVIACQKD